MSDQLPGQLIYIFAVSILDAALLSWLVLIWYRRSVRRLMRQGAPGTAAAPSNATPPPSPSAISVDHVQSGLSLVEEQMRAAARSSVVRRGFNRLAVSYCAGAAAYAAVITALKYTSQSTGLPAVAWLVDWWTNLWPLVPTLVALFVLDRRLSARLVAFYMVGGAAGIALFTAAGQLLRGTLNSAPVTNIFWAMAGLAWSASIPLVLVAFTSWRRVRAVMPLALAATITFGFSSTLFRELLTRALDLGGFRSFFLGGAVFSSVAVMQYTLFMIVSLPVGWIAWLLLKAIARAYGNKAFSDVQLVVDCWWAVVAAEMTATTLSIIHGFSGIAGGLLAFAAYRLTVSAVLRGFRRPDSESRKLLLLRVFGYQARTESLFDRVAQTWRFHGPVQLIAGADLTMRTTDPGDLLALLGGHLADSYVAATDEIGSRLGRLDLRPDPDGRFRVNEVYCRDNTWRPTLEALLDSSDTVLMDLRSFSTSNAGCIFELEQLVRRLSSADIVFVCDKTTDMRLLRGVLTGAWAATERPSGTPRTAAISVVQIERQSPSEISALMDRLFRAPQPVPDGALAV
ncbi:MAG TPA: hypothetical protein VH497_22035 [Vicinamibacterales bacterium]